ncbi:MAG: serine hydrolase, partial [Chloroflexota bacterium]|nr:serine hydrolase [Chloroflexota bacterium]
ERLSGQSLEDYFREHIFGVLGMADSGFVLRAEQRSRLASMHVRQPDGSLQAIPFEIPQQPEFFMGGGGLYSTGPDYLRFLRTLLGGGQVDGARVLRPETVREMGRNHIGELNVGAENPGASQFLHLHLSVSRHATREQRSWKVRPRDRLTAQDRHGNYSAVSPAP